ncbi:MAG: zf-HC2 domain-containing protein [Acidobacteria bacterium]|nr:zf-HC2 domain-containing protein [Acidobacteriota bacterium]
MNDDLTCDRSASLISRHIDGRLTDEERRRLDGHLEHCGGCRDDLIEQHLVADVLRARQAISPPAGFAERLGARLDLESSIFGVADWRRWTWRLAPVAAALFLVAAVTAGQRDETTAGETTGALSTWPASVARNTPGGASVMWSENVSGDTLLSSVLTGSSPATREGESR